MTTFYFLCVSILIGVGLNYLLSLVLTSLVKHRGTFSERVVLSSVDDADSIRLEAIDDEKKARLWADAMNIIMRSENKTVARK